METKHTKGEWKHLKQPITNNGFYIQSSELIFIGEVGGGEGCKIYEIEANAKLIAAAPELLDALMEIVNAADGDGWKQLDGTLSKARNAIKKAKE